MARFRERFVMVSWRDTAGDNNAIRDRVLAKLTSAQLSARGGLGSTRGSTPGSSDSQGKVIPDPGRRTPKTTNTGSTATEVQQLQVQTVHAGPSDGATAYTGYSSVSSPVYQPSRTHRDSSTSQQEVQTNRVSPNGQYQSPSSPSSDTLPHRQRNMGANLTVDGAQQPHHSYATSTDPQPYSKVSYVSASHNATLPAVRSGIASGDANTRMQYGQASTVYAASRYTQQAENTLHDGFPRALQESDQLPSDGDDWEKKNFGIYECGDGDDEKENRESSGNDNDDGSDWNEEADADMLLTEESPRLESLTPEECYQLERYLEEDRIRTQMCLNGMISVDEPMLDMQNNEHELKQGLKRTRGKNCDDDKVKELQDRRAKRSRREEGATGSNSQPLSERQEPTCNGFDDSQSRPWRGYRRQGAFAKTSRHPTTRPVGSAVQRLHSDRLRRPSPKATVGQKDLYESLHFPQPEIFMHGEWTVYNCHTDSQPTHYTPQPPGGEEGLYTNIGQRQGRPAPYESRQDNTMETSNPDTSSGERQSSHRQAYEQPAASTIQDDPFYSDELFNGMLNGQPDNDRVGSIYTRSQQQEIDEYYYRLMTPRPRSEPGTSAPENIMPPPQRLRTEDPPTVFVADLLNPHSRPQVRQGGGLSQHYSQHNVPVAHAQSGSAASVAQVTAGASQPADESDLAVGDITLWNPGWSAFINDHDAEPLLRAHYPDETPSNSRPGNPHQ